MRFWNWRVEKLLITLVSTQKCKCNQKTQGLQSTSQSSQLSKGDGHHSHWLKTRVLQGGLSAENQAQRPCHLPVRSLPFVYAETRHQGVHTKRLSQGEQGKERNLKELIVDLLCIHIYIYKACQNIPGRHYSVSSRAPDLQVCEL